jgi:NADH-quinone oxidoreductase subunit N
VIHLLRHSREGNDVRSLRGLSRARPALAAALALCFLSLGGVPLTAGFLGKLYLLKAAWNADLVVPSVVLVVTSVIGLGYYLRVVAAMYMEPEQEPVDGAPLFSPLCLSIVTLCCSVGIVLIGVWPQPLLRCLAP